MRRLAEPATTVRIDGVNRRSVATSASMSPTGTSKAPLRSSWTISLIASTSVA